jgi:hypothetical protein
MAPAGGAGGGAHLRRGVGRQRPPRPSNTVVVRGKAGHELVDCPPPSHDHFKGSGGNEMAPAGGAGGLALLRRGVGRQRPPRPSNTGSGYT